MYIVFKRKRNETHMPPFSRIKFYSGTEGKCFCGAGGWTGEPGKLEGAGAEASLAPSRSASVLFGGGRRWGNGKQFHVLALYQLAPGSLPAIPSPLLPWSLCQIGKP